RQATAARVALPVLVADIALPAADTKADPAWLDAEREYVPNMSEYTAPVIAEAPPEAEPGAVDYVLDPDARAAGEHEPASAVAPEPVSVPPRTAIDIEDYFDSAPIPAAAIEAPVSSYRAGADDEQPAKPGGAGSSAGPASGDKA
ncbi:protoheme IX synthesis protein, partial [Bordetella pertussis]